MFLTKVRMCLTISAAMLLVVSVAEATPLFTFKPGFPSTPSSGSNPIQIGSRFSVVNTISATQIGAYVLGSETYYDEDVTANDINFTGLLYDSDLNLIDSVLIPAGTSIDSQGFAYANFSTPHTLLAGQEYVITVWRGAPDDTGALLNYLWAEFQNSVDTDPNAMFLNTQFRQNSNYGDLPTETLFLGYNDMGANLQFNLVPEPAGFSLIIIGVVAGVRRARRQMTRQN